MSEGASAMPEGYIPPNIDPKCTWALGKDKSLSPHRHLPAQWVETTNTHTHPFVLLHFTMNYPHDLRTILFWLNACTHYSHARVIVLTSSSDLVPHVYQIWCGDDYNNVRNQSSPECIPCMHFPLYVPLSPRLIDMSDWKVILCFINRHHIWLWGHV